MKYEKDLINRIKFSLTQLAFTDIKRASAGGAKMGAFILASCFIDYLAGFYYGHKSKKEDYINFINKHLRRYDGGKIYYSVRNGLVHNYSVERDFIFSENRDDGPHLGKHKNGKIILNLDEFIKDIENAMNKYFNALEHDNNLKLKAINRFKRGKMLEVIR